MLIKNMMQSKIKLSAILLSLLLSGCAGNPKNADDPYENLNRATYKFNKGIDKVILKPAAYTYKNFTPRPLQDGVGNFFNNLGEVTTIGNDILQFKFRYVAHDFARFTINTTIGIVGLFDVASVMGLDRRKEDFGQTLYTWGYKKSAYLVLPILGPSTIRDAAGTAIDYFAMSVWPWIESDTLYYSLLGLNLVDTRARLLHKETILDALAVDEYSLLRDAYLQNRIFLSTDGAIDFTGDEDPLDDLDGYFDDDVVVDSDNTAKIEANDEPQGETNSQTEAKSQNEAKSQEKRAVELKKEVVVNKSEVKNSE